MKFPTPFLSTFNHATLPYTYIPLPSAANKMRSRACPQSFGKYLCNLIIKTNITRRDTHLDALTDRLKEPRVRHIIDAIISGTGQLETFNADDVQYIRDLGLITQKNYAIANPIYQEIIPRALLTTTEPAINQDSL